MLQQYEKDITGIWSPLLGVINKYEKFIEQLLEVFGLSITSVGYMEEDNILHQWDAYEAHYFVAHDQFNVVLMDRYTYLITQCQQVVGIIEKLEGRRKNVGEILKKYKFRI